MRVGIASDHGGFELKQELAEALKKAGHEIVDFGALSLNTADDYPDYVVPLARAVARADVERGIAVCGSGVGAAIAANKIHGARACLIHDGFSAHQGVEDDNMNILCLGGRIIGPMWPRNWCRLFWRQNSPGPSVISAAWPRSRHSSASRGEHDGRRIPSMLAGDDRPASPACASDAGIVPPSCPLSWRSRMLARRLPDPVSAGIELRHDISYSKMPHPHCTLDLAIPQAPAGLRPGIIVIHGGGWIEGDKASFATAEHGVPGNIVEFAQRGFVAATINYRLSGECALSRGAR